MFFPSLNPLRQINELRGRYFNAINTISLRRGDFPFSLLMPALSLGVFLLSKLKFLLTAGLCTVTPGWTAVHVSLFSITNIKSKIYPMFCYHLGIVKSKYT